MKLPPVHEGKTPSGIHVPDPDQGTACLLLQFVMPSTSFMIWEPFDEGEGGHNLYGFMRRWAAWVASEEPWFGTVDPRFGHPMGIPRSAIAHVAGVSVHYHRKEDVRAPHRAGGLAVPVGGGGFARQLANGDIEINVPTGRRRGR